MLKRKLIAVQHVGEVGGSGIGLLAVLNILRNHFEIVIYCVDTPKSMVELFESNGYHVVSAARIPVFLYHSGGPGLMSIDFLSSLLKIKEAKQHWGKIFLTEKPDVVLVNSMVMSWMWEPIKACNAKAICHVREVLPNRWDPRANKILGDLESFDATWFISEHERTYFDLKHPMTAVIRDCLIDIAPDMEESISAQAGDGMFHVLYVGGLSKLKGIYTLLKSVDYLNDHIVVDLAGYFPEKAEFIKRKYSRFGFIRNFILRLKNLSRRNMLKVLYVTLTKHAGKVNLIGHRNDLGELYKNCNVLVFPSQKPHQSRPAFEAGFYGKSVIISDFKQTRENVLDGYNGLTFKPNDSRDLAIKINRLCDDRYLCKRLGENNRKKSIEKHTFEAVQTEMRLFWQRFCT